MSTADTPPPAADGGSSAGPAGPAVPRLLADLDWCLAQAASGRDGEAGGRTGAVWRLAEAERQLDANLVRLPPHGSVARHGEFDVDVLLLVLSGSGVLRGEPEPLDLMPHTLVWLPRGSRRALDAGPEGLAYLTVHRARTGMRIRTADDPALARAAAGDRQTDDGMNVSS